MWSGASSEEYDFARYGLYCLRCSGQRSFVLADPNGEIEAVTPSLLRVSPATGPYSLAFVSAFIQMTEKVEMNVGVSIV